MNIIRIDAVQKSKSGKAWAVKSGDQYYAADLESGIERYVGQTLDVEIQTFGKDGRAIKKYSVVGQNAPQTPQNAPRAPNEPTVAPYWQAFVSNQVANAIAAGLIKEPGQIKEWTFAAMNAIKGAVEGDISF